jgi:chitin deacetylase
MKRKMKKRWLVLLIISAVVLLLVSLYYVISARGFQFFGRLVNHIDTDKKVVYFTFDDGPTKNTERILGTLDELNVKASFFLIGQCIEENPGLTQQILDAGHDIGNHSYSHPRLALRSPNSIKNEVDQTNTLIKNTGYNRGIFFRPPYGKKFMLLPWYLDQIGQTTVMWTLEPDSFEDVNKDADSMAQYVIDNVSDGAIILLHPMNDDTDKTLDAIKMIVTELRNLGYSFERLSDGIKQ